MPEENKSKMVQELAMIAHEFRRPLDTIAKSAELVNRAQVMEVLKEEKLSEIMDGIINNCNRLNLLTYNILEIAQIDNGSAKVVEEKGNLQNFLDDLKEYLSFYEHLHNMRFVFKINLKDPYIVCDFEKLERILLNLISNSVKYSRNINRRVDVIVADQEGFISFSVKDRGIGIDKEGIDKIFKKFYRVESFNTRQTEGCGLGLTIVSKFVEILKGEISVKSEVNQGSEFTVKIPKKNTTESSKSKILELSYNYQLYKSSVDEIFSDIN